MCNDCSVCGVYGFCCDARRQNLVQMWDYMVLSGEFGSDLDVCEDECEVMHLCLEFLEMEHTFKKFVLAIRKSCNRATCFRKSAYWLWGNITPNLPNVLGSTLGFPPNWMDTSDWRQPWMLDSPCWCQDNVYNDLCELADQTEPLWCWDKLWNHTHNY